MDATSNIHEKHHASLRTPVASCTKPDYIARMSGRTETELEPAAGAAPAAGAGNPVYEVVDGALASGLIVVCDHASNYIPPEYGGLGLPEDQLKRHIAYDIGVAAVTRMLARLLNVPAVLSNFSRLLIDPNRGLDDPTLVMRVSDGAVIPGNAKIDQAGIDARIGRFYKPYDDAVCGLIDRSLSQGVVPALLSIHSFTPSWRGTARPWHAGVLWDRDGRFALPLLDALAADKALIVGNNEPYTGELEGDMMNRQGSKQGLAHALLEIRQDLIADQDGVQEWAHRLAAGLPDLVADEDLHHVFGDDN